MEAVGEELGDVLPARTSVRPPPPPTIWPAYCPNAAEEFFSLLNRSLDGTHHHVSTEHLGRYLAEFDFRATTKDATDSQRMRIVVANAGACRLTYGPLTGE